MTPGGPIFQLLAQDHARLESLLARAFLEPADIDLTSFGEFRAGLLRHVALEEKLLIPAVTAARRGEPLPFARRLRVDHGALAALLVPTPVRSTADELRKILVPHNALEEGPGGLYQACEELLSAADQEKIVERMRAYPPVRVAQYHDGPRVCRTAEEALRISGLQAHARRAKD